MHGDTDTHIKHKTNLFLSLSNTQSTSKPQNHTQAMAILYREIEAEYAMAYSTMMTPKEGSLFGTRHDAESGRCCRYICVYACLGSLCRVFCFQYFSNFSNDFQAYAQNKQRASFWNRPQEPTPLLFRRKLSSRMCWSPCCCRHLLHLHFHVLPPSLPPPPLRLCTRLARPTDGANHIRSSSSVPPFLTVCRTLLVLPGLPRYLPSRNWWFPMPQ